MRYELIGKNDFSLEPIKTILINRGITDIDEFFDVGVHNTHSFKLLKNMDEGVDCLLKHIENGDEIHIVQDSDADGVTSTAVFYNYLKLLEQHMDKTINVTYSLHTGKQHGLSNDIIIPEGVKLIVLPDSSSNDYEQHKLLSKRGIDILVLDHHKADYESCNAIVINNQLSPDYPNKSFCGAGITYKFCKAVDERIGVNFANEFLDLVAVGNIGDVMDAKELETRYYMLEGLKPENIKNPFLQELIKKQDFSMKGKVNITSIGWYIAPLINATIRVGTQEEKENMLKAFIGSKETLPYSPRVKKGEEKVTIDQPIAEAMARICVNIKSRQDRLRDKGVALIEERIKEKKLDENKILMVDCSDILDSSLTGLVANQLADKYKRPALLLRRTDKLAEDDDIIFGGSARGYDKSVVKNLKDFCLSTGEFIFCEGHEQSFGINIKAGNLIAARDKMNEALKDVVLGEDVYSVDFVIPANKLTTGFIKEIGLAKDVWGNGVDEPCIVITDILVNAKDIGLLGKRNDTMKFTYKNVEFVRFFSNEDLFMKMTLWNKNSFGTNTKNLKISILGTCQINEWNGNKTPQVEIVDFEVSENKELIF